MRVKLLTNLGSNDFPEHRFLEGEEHEIDDSTGGKLVAKKLAVDVTPQQIVAVAAEPELKAVPESVTQTAETPASAKSRKRGE